MGAWAAWDFLPVLTQTTLTSTHQSGFSKRILRFAGHVCSSVQWGAWGGVGMVATSAAVLSRMARAGIGTVQPATGLTALSSVLFGRSTPALVSVWWYTLVDGVSEMNRCYQHAAQPVTSLAAGAGIEHLAKHHSAHEVCPGV